MADPGGGGGGAHFSLPSASEGTVGPVGQEP